MKKRKILDIEKRCLDFSLLVIDLSKTLRRFHHYEISSQIIKSSTSIGANLAEASSARSKKEFISLSGIALREARETSYWLEIIERLKLEHPEKINRLKSKLDEIIAIIVTIINKSKKS